MQFQDAIPNAINLQGRIMPQLVVEVLDPVVGSRTVLA